MKTARPEVLNLDANGDYSYDLHHMEYVFLDVLDWPNEILERGFTWYLKPSSPARFLESAEDAGVLKWQHFETEELMIEHLIECKQHVPLAERSFGVADVHAYPAPSPIINLIMDFQ